MSDEPVPVRYSPVSATMTQPAPPLFTHEDVVHLLEIEASLIAEYPEDNEILASIASRIGQWLDSRGVTTDVVIAGQRVGQIDVPPALALAPVIDELSSRDNV